MYSLQLKAHVGKDGILRLETPIGIENAEVEVVLVFHAVSQEKTDAMGYPIGFFERTYGSLADVDFERPPQGEFEVREEIE